MMMNNEKAGVALDAGSPARGGPGGKIMHMPANMLPANCKEGDTYTIRVAGAPDDEGDVPVEIQDGASPRGQEETWENAARRELSPQAGGEEAA